MDLYYIILILIFGADLFDEGHTYSKCDRTIEGKIETRWGNSIPKNLIGQAKANGKELVILTTPNYYPANLKCVYSVFSNNQFTMTKVPKEGSPTSTNFNIKEDKGKTVSETTDAVILRYHVYQGNGVTAVYTCNTKGEDSNNQPDGFVKVKDGNTDQSAVEAAKNALKDVGVNVSEQLCQK